jgi:segregation and condensation protein B
MEATEKDDKKLSRDEKKKQVEAILFACGQEIDIDRIAMLMQLPNKRGLNDIILELKKEYDERDSPLMIISGEEGIWKLTVRERYLGLVRTIAPHTELSKTILETLAVIAWKQPILQSEVIGIRTNKAYEHITELEKMGFIVKEKHGRTYMVKLSQKFFEYFDIDDEAKLRGIFAGVKDKGEFQQKMAEFVSNLGQDLPLLMDKSSEKDSISENRAD